MGKLFKASPMSKDTASAIMGGTPLIKVVVFKDSIQVNIVSMQTCTLFSRAFFYFVANLQGQSGLYRFGFWGYLEPDGKR